MKIAIASGKGGTGKTTLSTNLASYIADSSKVVLVDIDVEEPNSGIFVNCNLVNREVKFKQIPEWNNDKCNHHKVCKDVCNFNSIIALGNEIVIFPQLCHSCYACVDLCPSKALVMVPQRIGELSHYEKGNFSFVESRLDIGQEQAVPLISQTINYVKEKFNSDYLKIYDSPPGTSCPMVESIKNVNLVILVTEPTPFGLYDLKLAYEVVQYLEKKSVVVINRWGIGNNDVEKYCNDNDIPIIAKIPNSKNIAELYSRGELIYNKIPEFKYQIEKIANYLYKS